MTTRMRVYILLGVILVLLFFQLMYWHIPVLGWFLFGLYLWGTGLLWRSFYLHLYQMAPRSLVSRVFGPLTSWFTILSFGAVCVVWYTLTPFLNWLCLLLGAIVSVSVSYIAKGKRLKKDTHALTLRTSWKLFPCKPMLAIAFLLVGILFFVIVSRSSSSDILFSPWQSLDLLLLPAFFLLTLALGVLVFSKIKVTGLLFLIVTHSLLLHLYLPASHEQPWGGDVWRHVAAESQLVEGEVIPPVLFGDEVKKREILGLQIPEALVIPHKYIYGQFWAGAVIISQLTAIDLVSFNIWYLPLLWGVTFPILLFYLGKTLFHSIHKGMVLSFLGSVPFTFQALGSFTLPNSLGFLLFLFVLSLWFRFLREGRSHQATVPMFFALFSVFGYLLYAMILWAVICASLLFRYLDSLKVRLVSLVGKTVACTCAVLFFPVIDALVGGSVLQERFPIIQTGKQMFGELSGWYMARAIRPYDTAVGNIFYNHTPSYSFVSSVFTDMRWHVFVFVIILILLACAGFYTLLLSKSTSQHMLAFLGLLVIGGYLVGWYVFVGDRLFVRRLDPVVALCILLYAIIGTEYLVDFFRLRYQVRKKAVRVIGIVSLVLISWSATTVYASGPDMRVLASGEVEAARHVVLQGTRYEQMCIIADAWVLLAIEGLSNGSVVAGGFPVDGNFSQTERALVYKEMQITPRESILEYAKRITGASNCSLLLHQDKLSDEMIALITEVMQVTPIQVGTMIIWL